MPRLIAADTTESIELAELIETLETSGFDPQDEDNFASFGGALKKLGNNKSFLGDLIIGELKQRCAGQLRDNQYSAQVILLHSGTRYIIRANFWPAMKDSVIRHSGTDPFFYGVAHDHNFSFLTVGYFGPGYWSDYYEYDYGAVAGYPGEKVALRFVEKARLEEGKVMLYRAHQDVHLQLAADEMSISLNIVEASHSSSFRDQYRFDAVNGTLEGIMTRISLEPLLALAATQAGEDGRDLVTDYARRHPSDRIRWCALRAVVSAEPSIDSRLARFEAATADPSPLIAALARREAERIEVSRRWIEAPAA
ncbi:hypothetical protein GCM10023232_05100 [Sphingosinicella ginsenosidimutans]|uniref:Transposase n=1 Tax=Allosphingosinicella ginsenosidimutans TaxID=1176539 RepID=A0A5C6TV64_9SPHN|nr:transposase [Sphingosinicella ginsenosidimutans]TXC64364.1 transposase [Sphingosinicella ginsenosidimutans]